MAVLSALTNGRDRKPLTMNTRNPVLWLSSLLKYQTREIRYLRVLQTVQGTITYVRC